MDFHCTTPGLQTTSASPSEADAVLEGKTDKTKIHIFLDKNYCRHKRFGNTHATKACGNQDFV